MRRILVIGSGGAGKSTFSKRLGMALDIPVYHLDNFFWKPGWIHLKANEFDEILMGLLAGDKWIIDGNYCRTLERRLEKADTVFYLDPPTHVCLWRIMKRRWIYRSKPRPDMNEGCPEKIDWDFFKWVLNFKRNERPSMLNTLKKYEINCDIKIFNRASEPIEYVRQFENYNILGNSETAGKSVNGIVNAR